MHFLREEDLLQKVSWKIFAVWRFLHFCSSHGRTYASRIYWCSFLLWRHYYGQCWCSAGTMRLQRNEIYNFCCKPAENRQLESDSTHQYCKSICATKRISSTDIRLRLTKTLVSLPSNIKKSPMRFANGRTSLFKASLFAWYSMDVASCEQLNNIQLSQKLQNAMQTRSCGENFA